MEVSEHFLVALSPSAFTQRANLPSLMNLRREYSKKEIRKICYGRNKKPRQPLILVRDHLMLAPVCSERTPSYVSCLHL